MPGVDKIKEHERVFLVIEQTKGLINIASQRTELERMNTHLTSFFMTSHKKVCKDWSKIEIAKNKTIDLKRWIPARFQNFLHSCKHHFFFKCSVRFNQRLESYLILYGFFELFRQIRTNIDIPLHSSDNVVAVVFFHLSDVEKFVKIKFAFHIFLVKK